MMRSWFLLLILYASHAEADENWRMLRPCFERYLQTKLANLVPFHSEGRMPTEDHCLRFCAESASRCRSIVYEPLRHVCHFFLDEGSDMAVPAQHMSYFKVTTQECLDHVSEVLGPMDIEGEEVEFSPIDEDSPGISPDHYHASSIDGRNCCAELQDDTFSILPVESSTQPLPTLATTLQDEVAPDKAVEMSREFTTHLPPAMAKPHEGRRASSMDTEEAERELRAKMQTLKELFPHKFQELIREKEAEDEDEDGADLLKAAKPTPEEVMQPKPMAVLPPSTPIRKETEIVTEPLPESDGTAELSPARRSRFFTKAKVLQMKEEQLQPGRRGKFDTASVPLNFDGVRRSPKRVVQSEYEDVSNEAAVRSPYLDKAKNFLQGITGGSDDEEEDVDYDSSEQQPGPKTQVQPAAEVISVPQASRRVFPQEKRVLKKVPPCYPEEAPLWVLWEGADQDMGHGPDTNWVESRAHCENQCNALNDCLGYTFHDKTNQCEATLDFDGVSLQTSRARDTSTRTKFCFSDDLPVFNNCPPMRGFVGYSLQMQPREEFTNLPTGYDGLRACVELCVLSTEYTCKSASFLAAEGRCLLNTESSQTHPEYFRKTPVAGHLYVENECSRTMYLSPGGKEINNF
ncbi:unnamed protein product, partial [Mesorhabditis spiculigera]